MQAVNQQPLGDDNYAHTETRNQKHSTPTTENMTYR